MELAVSQAEDQFLEELKLHVSKPTASYVNSQRNVTYNAIGSNIYSSVSGARIVKFMISDSRGWMDPDSVRVMFDIVNTDSTETKTLKPLKPYGFFSRLRILSRGQILHDISEYNRIHAMFSLLQTKNKAEIEDIEGCLNPMFNILTPYDPKEVVGTDPNLWFKPYTKIQANERLSVMFKPFCGLFTQSQFLPLKYLPIEVELELSSDPLINIVDPAVDTSNKTSSSWQLENFKFICNQNYFSQPVENNFEKIMLGENEKAKVLQIHCDNLISNVSTILSLISEINITKTAHSMKKIYVNFIETINTSDNLRFWKKPYFNLFFGCPSGNDLVNVNYRKTLDFKKIWLTIGSQKYPDLPYTSSNMAY